jgi:cytidyltransferase-like protein
MSKIIKLNNLKSLRSKFKNKKIILAHGVFDILHIGHIEYFKEAKNLGDILIVSVTANRFVNKGVNRPYFDKN